MKTNTNIKFLAFSTIAALVSVNQTQAALYIDLRAQNGSHTIESTGPGLNKTVTIDAWAVITGSLGNPAKEGLQSVIFGIKTADGAGFDGYLTGGITAARLAPGWNGPNSQIGQASNITNDGYSDWGNASNTGLTLGASYFRARSSKVINNSIDWGDANSPGTYHILANGGVEFLVGSFDFTYSYDHFFSIDIVPFIPLGGFTPIASWYEDTSDISAAVPTGSRSVSTGFAGPFTPNAGQVNSVSIIDIPEPATLGMMSLLGFGLARRLMPSK